MTNTRERILIEASKLFAHKGYLDTSTRDIAQAVGVRQPSLFYHFATKSEIFAELLSRDLNLALQQIHAVTSDTEESSVGAKLFAYLVWDATSISYMPTNILGLYERDTLGESEFEDQWTQRAELHRLTEQLVQSGMDSGVFSPTPNAAFVRQAISALTLNAARNKTSDTSLDTDTEELALFIVRAILVNASSIDEVRAQGMKLWERLAAAHPSIEVPPRQAPADKGTPVKPASAG